ncbi:hypothetical protein EVAR_34281_1 [Eumeta japonica]|uniref:Uncharacterized protein n=1 Tax=Eumeta variegata TaxID=151549 RepID=A0A4C1VZW3_EUMVA|nr:hypothetical protein EVAR_34281_1 [Eumeta japonica]
MSPAKRQEFKMLPVANHAGNIVARAVHCETRAGRSPARGLEDKPHVYKSTHTVATSFFACASSMSLTRLLIGQMRRHCAELKLLTTGVINTVTKSSIDEITSSLRRGNGLA